MLHSGHNDEELINHSTFSAGLRAATGSEIDKCIAVRHNTCIVRKITRTCFKHVETASIDCVSLYISVLGDHLVCL